MGDNQSSSDMVSSDDPDIKVILLGDSAVGKSKLMERFLEDEYQPRRVRKMNTSSLHLRFVFNGLCAGRQRLTLFQCTSTCLYLKSIQHMP